MKTNLENYEERFVDYMEGQLDATEMKEVETFVAQHPELEEDFKLFCSTKLEPDSSIVFTKKDSLKKSETVIRPLFWKIAVAAACVALIIGIGIRFLKPHQELAQQPMLANLTPIKAQPIIVPQETPSLRTSDTKVVSIPKPTIQPSTPKTSTPVTSMTPIEPITPVLAIAPKPLQREGTNDSYNIANRMNMELDERLAAVEPFYNLDSPEDGPLFNPTEQAVAFLQDSFFDNVRQTSKDLYKQTAKKVMGAYHTADYIINEAKDQLVALR